MNESQQISATLMQVGDDEDGNPRLLFHTTREQLMRLGTVPLYELSRLTIEPTETMTEDQKLAAAERVANREPEEPEEQPEPTAEEMERVDLWREKRRNARNGGAE